MPARSLSVSTNGGDQDVTSKIVPISLSLLTPALHLTLDLHIASDVPFCICNHVDIFSFEVKLGAPNPSLT